MSNSLPQGDIGSPSWLAESENLGTADNLNTIENEMRLQVETAFLTNALAELLALRYKGAPPKGKIASLLLFGIQYGEQIRERKLSVHSICELAGLGSLSSTVNSGVKLSEFVQLKPPYS